MPFHPDSIQRLARFMTAADPIVPEKQQERPRCKRCRDPLYDLDQQYCEHCRGFEREPQFDREAAGQPPHQQERQFGQPRQQEPTNVEPTMPGDMPDLEAIEREQLAYEEAGHMDTNNEIAYIAKWFAEHPGATEQDFMEAHEDVGEDPAQWAGDRKASADAPDEEALQRRIYELIGKVSDPAARTEMMQLMRQLSDVRNNRYRSEGKCVTCGGAGLMDNGDECPECHDGAGSSPMPPKVSKRQELGAALQYLRAQKLNPDVPGRRGPVDPEKTQGLGDRSVDLIDTGFEGKNPTTTTTRPRATFGKLNVGDVFTTNAWQSQHREYAYYKKVDKFRAVPYRQNTPNMSPDKLKLEAIAMSPGDEVSPVGPSTRGNFHEMFRNQDKGERL